MRATTPAPERRALNSFALAWLVALREIREQVKSRSFIISTAIFVVTVVAGICLPQLIGGDGDEPPAEPVKVAVAAGVTLPDTLGDPAWFTITPADSAEAATALVADGTVDAALVPAPATPVSPAFAVVADQEADGTLMGALTSTPNVTLLDPSPFGGAPMGYILSLAFGLLFMMVAMIFGQTIAMNTVIEKQTRIVEILLAAVPDRALLGGKVLGNSILALGETVVIAGAALVTLKATGQDTIFGMLSAPLLWYVVFFVTGFIMLASLYAGLASLVSRIEDIGNAVMPITLVVMLPYVLPLILSDNDAAMRVLSYIPIISTVVMPIRQILGTAQWWEAIVALAILVLATFGAILAGARIYSRALLQTGRKLKLREALTAR
ncbi:MAG: ABC transporter permease [Propionibacteriaceae bacterium]|jgi:ABC-2 type transport system permease protein|nr:ABC transporter permease [Propionibacteriaceae bacterium]